MLNTNSPPKPFDLLFFEKYILFACLRKGDIDFHSTCVEHLHPELFRNPIIAKVMRVIQGFYLEHDRIPNLQEIRVSITDKDDLKKFKTVLDEIKEFDKELDSKWLVLQTEIFVRQRMALNLIESSVEKYSKDAVLDEGTLISGIDKITELSFADNVGHIFFDQECMDNFIAFLNQKDAFISTGYKELDEDMKGGFFKEGKALYTFCGPTNIGKSIVLANIAANTIRQNLKVLLISFEMSQLRYAKRIASILTSINSDDLATTENLSENLFSVQRQNDNAQLIVKEFPPGIMTPRTIAGFIRKLKKKMNFSPDMVIMDYHTLMQPTQRQESSHKSLQKVTQETRALSYAFPCPIISVIQMNREGGEGGSKSVSKVSGSWDMMADIDTNINIWQEPGDREAGVLRYMVTKGRDGDKGIERIWQINYKNMQLTETNPHHTHTTKEQEALDIMLKSDAVDIFDFSA
jgi:hypothetical protein